MRGEHPMQVDTVFKDALIYNIFLKTWSITDAAVLHGKILHIGDSKKAGLTPRETIDCRKQPLIPGLIDIHLHIESSLCTPLTFSKQILPHGVTTIVSEPHEIANVFGLDGITAMIEASEDAEVDIFYGIPSSVPSTNSRFETTGGTIGQKEVAELIENQQNAICLGEVMNYSSLIGSFEQLIEGKEISSTLELVKYMQKYAPHAAIEGHCPWVTGLDLSKLLYFGIDSDHCLQSLKGIEERLKNGGFIELQEKSITPEIIEFLNSHNAASRYSFVTDDVPPNQLVAKGHLDQVIRKALKLGLPLEQVIEASSFSAAVRMGLQDRGLIAPGKLADLILLKDRSPEFSIEAVYKRGIHAADQKSNEVSTYQFPSRFYTSLNLDPKFSLDKIFSVQLPEHHPDTDQITVRVMRKNKTNTYTDSVTKRLNVRNRIVEWEKNINLVSVIDRYSGTNNFSQGFAEGDVLQNGAVCSTYAHDHHNILLLGDNAHDMKIAYQWTAEHQGGFCVVSNGKVEASIPLPIAGILSEKPIAELAEEVEQVQSSLQRLGIGHPNPMMSIATITLPVSPKLKITDRGLISVETNKLYEDPFITP